MNRCVRSRMMVVGLLLSVAALAYLGLPCQPLEVAALRLTQAPLTTTPTSWPTFTPSPSPVSQATLQVGKWVDQEVATPGTVLQYVLVVMNDMLWGEDPGTNVTLMDALPAELDLVSGSLSLEATYDPATRTIHWQGVVPRGGSIQVLFKARIAEAAAGMGSLTNTMSVTDAFGQQREASAQTQVVLPTPTATSTPTPTPGDIVLTGRVYDALLGPTHGIAGATVSVLMSVPRRFPTTTAQDGSYTLIVPSLYAEFCAALEAWAPGYYTWSQPVTAAELRAQPQRDIGLTPRPYHVWLPVVVANGRVTH